MQRQLRPPQQFQQQIAGDETTEAVSSLHEEVGPAQLPIRGNLAE